MADAPTARPGRRSPVDVDPDPTAVDVAVSDVALRIVLSDRAVRRLARLKRKTLTETICEAVEHEYQRECGRIPLIDRLQPIQDQFAARLILVVSRRTRRSSMRYPGTRDVSRRFRDHRHHCARA
jgi:hypothetical protein